MSRSPLVLDTSTANQRQLRGRSVDFGRAVETNNAILSFWWFYRTEICRVFPSKVPVSHSKVTSSRSNCCPKKCTNDQVRDRPCISLDTICSTFVVLTLPRSHREGSFFATSWILTKSPSLAMHWQRYYYPPSYYSFALYSGSNGIWVRASSSNTVSHPRTRARARFFSLAERGTRTLV